MSFLQRPPYDREALTMVSNTQLARLGMLIEGKREAKSQIRSIDRRIKSLLTPRKRK